MDRRLKNRWPHVCTLHSLSARHAARYSGTDSCRRSWRQPALQPLGRTLRVEAVGCTLLVTEKLKIQIVEHLGSLYGIFQSGNGKKVCQKISGSDRPRF